jgi:hypothetical protein
MTMEMPKPSEQHRKLAALAGAWSGVEKLYPSPWDQGGDATSRAEGRVAADGFWVETDYEQSRDGKVNYRAHGVFGWDPKAERYLMYWFDSMGSVPSPALGTWEGDTLTFELGASRYVYKFGAPGRYDFAIHTAQGGDWKPMMESVFTSLRS